MVGGGALWFLRTTARIAVAESPPSDEPSADSSESQRGINGAIPCGMANNSFRDLEVWQESMLLVEDIYRVTAKFPSEERYGLSAQLRRAAVSIPSNIGEGARRKRLKAYLYHLDVSLGSQGEVDVQAEIGQRLGFCAVADYEALVPRIDRIGRMLNGLISSLQPEHDAAG
jgi:four helix bundle protein